MRGFAVARMNWTRASSQVHMARAYDYSARADDADHAVLGRPDVDAVKGRTPSAPPKKRKTASTASRRAAPPRSPTRSASLSTAEALKEEARRSGRPLHEVVASHIPEPPKPRRRRKPLLPRPEPKVEWGSGSRPLAAPTLIPAAPPKPTKGERTQAEAERRGISVEALLDERRQKAAADVALHHEANRLGITVKELRARLAK